MLSRLWLHSVILNNPNNMKNIYKINNKIKLESGFTLIETMVSVTILSLALAALISLTSSNLFLSRYTKNEITANYLLQEVVDYVKNDRDTQVFKGGIVWSDFLIKYKDAGCFDKGCRIDVSKDQVFSCGKTSNGDFGDIPCDVLLYNDDAISGGFFNYDKGNLDKFKRIIKMTENGDEVTIIVEVEWKNGNLTKSRNLQSSIINWYQ